ncbi:MAG: prenyltransferase [Spirochaetes bacterium]|nr:prenyltransferase [Spirochaetota bacterium]
MQQAINDKRFATVKNWANVMRLPFTTVAVVPFGVGVYLAYAHGRPVSWLSALLGIMAVLFICIGCYLIGEIYDQQEDSKTALYGRTKFSGGTLMVASGTLSERSVMFLAISLFASAALMGLAIYAIHGSLLLLALGAFGIGSAVLYSMPPVRLVMRGVGELFIAFCYGWLTLVTGHLCASGSIPPYSYYFSIPVALTIFNVILINEFPDYEADRDSGKLNLLVRIGKNAGAVLYSVIAVLTSISIIVLWALFRSWSPAHLLAAAPAAILGLVLAVNVAVRRRWRSLETLEPICGLTIVLNHLSSITVGVLAIWR